MCRVSQTIYTEANNLHGSPQTAHRAEMLPRMYHIFRLKYIVLAVLIVFLLDFFGVFTHFFEQDFNESFDYPLNDINVPHYVRQMRNGKQPDVAPINGYNYTFITDCRNKCRQAGDDDTLIVPRVVFIVKSAMHHSERRKVIRQSWGFEKRFSDVLIRTVFTLGITDGHAQNQIDLQQAINKEHQENGDIVQANFIDSYFNNTVKTMMGMRWAIEYCPRSRFFMFVDDDYYVSTKNLLRFLRNPVNYPEYINEADETLRKLARHLSQSDILNGNQSAVEQEKIVPDTEHKTIDQKAFSKIEPDRVDMAKIKSAATVESAERKNDPEPIQLAGNRQLLDAELPYDVKLFAGFVFTTKPHRHKSSKWYVPLNEYKWNVWPTYVTAGSFVLSREALIEIYYTSMYTKHFRFDDIYLGIVALRANIEPLHSEEFYFYKANYVGPQSYRYVIATHGYDDSYEMLRVWTALKASGHA